jgi:hypothetical protein
MSAVPATDLQFGEFATYLKRALYSIGMRETVRPEDADVAIFLTYGIGEPRVTQYAESYPVYGQVSSASTSTVSSTAYNSYGGSSSMSGTISEPARYGVVGIGSTTVTNVTFDRYITISAVDVPTYKKTSQIAEVWKTSITSTGSSGDLRAVFPAILVGAIPYFGTNSGTQQTFTIDERDPRVLWIKGYPKASTKNQSRDITSAAFQTRQ